VTVFQVIALGGLCAAGLVINWTLKNSWQDANQAKSRIIVIFQRKRRISIRRNHMMKFGGK